MKYITTRFTALFLAFILILGLIPSAPVAVEAAQTVQIGDYIFFGAYNGQPILWRVISLDEKGDPLLFSEKLLSFKDFDAPGAYHGDSGRQEYGSNYWKDSNIRQWLNSSENVIAWIQNDPSLKNVMYNPYDTEKGFLADGNFTAAERKAIKPVTHKALLDEADEYKKDGGTESHQRADSEDFVLNYDDAYYQNVTDSVFFLSVKELKEYVVDRGWEKLAAPTEEAVLSCTDKDAYLSNEANWAYWLRTPTAEGASTTRIVDYIGIGSHMTNSREFNQNVGIRPAMYLDLSSAPLKAGSGTLRNPYMTEEMVRQQSAQPIQIGDYVRFGHYYGRPITWRVINMDENGAPLLFSDKILGFKAFDARGGYHQDDERKKNGSNYWPDSSLRQWLNSAESTIHWTQNAPSKNNVMYNPYDTEKGFLSDGNFTAAERNAIKPVTHKVLLSETDKAKKEGGTELHKYEGYYTTKYDDFIKAAVQNYDKAYYQNVTDSVFLLSVKEFIEYVYDKELGYLAVPTGEALENSPELVKSSTEHWDTAMSTDRAASWMLRTPQASSSDMVRMLEVLGMGVTDIGADTGACGVRPALYLKLSGLQKYGFGTQDYPYTIVAGTDISTGKDEPDPQQPSSWAVKDINEAVKLGIVESHMAFSYTKPIRRSELAELLVNLYYLKSGKSIERIVSEKGLDLKVSPFTDTADEDAVLASKLGMLHGKNGGIFDPNGSVPLQEASLILVNTAKAMGVSIPGAVAGSVIQGTQASGAFITREQAFAAALQLYKLPAAPAPTSGSGGTSAASASKTNTVGNTSGNLTNSGHIAQQGDWIYYSNEADGGKLYKSRTDGTGITKLRDERPSFINVVGDWVYYTGRGGIHKVRADGTEPTQVYIKGTGIYVSGDWIYYLDNGLYKIRTDGTERTKLADNCAGMTLSGDWIYYTNYVPVTNPNVFTPKSSEEGNLYKIRTDGTGKTKLNSDDCRSINIAGDWIYYANYDDGSNTYLKLYKIRTDGTGRTKVSDDSFGNFAYGINVSGDWIYYHNSSTPPGTLCKVKTDGTGKTKLTDDSCAWINVIGDWIYYSSGGKAYKVRTDGTARQIAW